MYCIIRATCVYNNILFLGGILDSIANANTRYGAKLAVNMQCVFQTSRDCGMKSKFGTSGRAIILFFPNPRRYPSLVTDRLLEEGGSMGREGLNNIAPEGRPLEEAVVCSSQRALSR